MSPSSSTDGAEQLHDSNQTTDVEKAEGVEVVDPNVVDWDGPDDPANPQNW